MILHYQLIHTSFGDMLAIASDEALYYLGFLNQSTPEILVSSFVKRFKLNVEAGKNTTLKLLDKELAAYSQGKLKRFTVKCHLEGTHFQKSVWKALQKIPYGQTWSYAKLAESIGKPRAFRAAANANGANSICILVPCHRVIQTNGKLGGYSSGLENKKNLLALENIVL